MQSLKRQNGMTAIGWLIVLALIGFFVLLTLRMLPSYLEYYKVVSTLDSLKKEGTMSSPAEIRRLIDRRFNISYRRETTPKRLLPILEGHQFVTEQLEQSRMAPSQR